MLLGKKQLKRVAECLNKKTKTQQTQGDSQMDSNTIAQTGLAEELAQLFSKHITTYITERYCQLNLKEAELKQDSPQFANSASV